jgi:hypothetical protein
VIRALVIAAVALAALAAGGSAGAASKYCSPTGDYCTSTVRQSGAVFLTLRTFSFRGKVRICVTDPRRKRVCRSFVPRPRPEGVFEVSARWHRFYPRGGRGLYRVGFFVGVTRLGPVLDFRIR